ncbi:xylulose kinase [candidate division KSB3 bacterium]|uniref:Xylulose kinase n=1 Tax=candidate division KSB3 bacterium TaxID=2044937 RepID=A0A2G6KD23_9BACT|nr:MAG: xylulose kinase [candidate division KSB3 bacterium]
MPRYVLGIDAGTESIRATIFNEQGQCLSSGSSPNQNIHKHPGWAEQSITQWEDSLIDAIKKAFSTCDIPPEEIEGVGIDGTSCTVIFLDAEQNHLRDAIIWMDVRAHKEAEEIAATHDPALKYTGFSNVSAEWFPCKVLWVKRHEPDVFEKAHTIFEHTDWLMYKLTGEITANINTTTIRWFYDAREGFPTSLYESIGLGDALDKLPSKIVRLGEVAGRLCPEIAEQTGLKAGIPVAGGGADAYVGVIGVNALKPGKLSLITGSSQLQIGLVRKEFHTPGIFGTFPDAILPGSHVVEAGQISTGSIVKWFKDHFVNSEIQQEADEKGVDVYEILDEKAQTIPPGSEGLIVLEHWQGNRTPWVDPTSRGVIRGLTLRHTPAHLFRAIMEAVAYGTAVILDRMESQGVAIDELVACGGATQSDVWMQIHADVTGKRITIPAEQQAVSLGSAILAAVGADIYGSIQDAANKMVAVEKVIEPDMERYKAYRFYVEQYAQTYELLKDESRKTAKHLEEI